jgi:hypothetical protein
MARRLVSSPTAAAGSAGSCRYRYRYFCRAGGADVRRPQKLNNIAYALIIGGALGNLFDRLWHGFVVDMIDFTSATGTSPPSTSPIAHLYRRGADCAGRLLPNRLRRTGVIKPVGRRYAYGLGYLGPVSVAAPAKQASNLHV